MKSKDYQYTKKRRGLSSIVGALLFVVLMVATFSVLAIALTTQTDIVETSRAVAATELKQQQEDFELDVFADPPVAGQAELHIEVRNEGQNSVEIFTVVVAEITDFANDFPTTLYDIPADSSFITPKDQQEILPPGLILLDLAVLPITDEFYTIKVISSLGKIRIFTIVCTNTECGSTGTGPGAGSLTELLFLDGPTGINTKTSTVVMFVTNTSDEIVTDVQPFRGFTGLDDCDFNDFWNEFVPQPGGTPETITDCEVLPNAPVDLNPHEVTIFKWDFTVGGDIDAEFQFCNYAIGTDPIPNPITSLPQSCDEITVIDPNDCGQPDCGPGGPGDTLPLDDRFITRPELFLTVPSPNGKKGSELTGPNPPISRSLWGANVVNPTDTTMFIYKITMTAYAPTANSNIVIIAPGGANDIECNPRSISPNVGVIIPGTQIQEAGDWSCPGENTIMWKNFSTPIQLDPNTVFPFLVKVEASNSGNDDIESVLVDSTVFTTSGSFGKGNYQTTWFQSGMYVNIYEADNIDSMLLDEINSSRSNIPCKDPQTFNIVLAEFDHDDLTFTNAGTKIVVNVPRAFSDAVVDELATTGILIEDNGPPELDEPSVTIHPDGTTQIIATVTEVLGNQPSPEAITLVFDATPPYVVEDQLMVMYTLAVGEGTGGATVGPLAEIVLHVVPTADPICIPDP